MTPLTRASILHPQVSMRKASTLGGVYAPGERVQGQRCGGLHPNTLLALVAAGLMLLAGGTAGLYGQTNPANPSGPLGPSGPSGLPGTSAPPAVRIDLDQAIQMAEAHNHVLQAARTLVPQSQAQELTASLRPNPVLTGDSLFVPVFSPHSLTSSTLDQITEFDLGVSYLIERGHKRQARIRAARDQTEVTESIVKDDQRVLAFSVAQQFIQVLLAKSTLDFA
ncbi:MAG: TolC family protein, partial [Terriglobia bacterium]